MSDVDAQTINAYVDGELDAKRHREFEAVLFTEPALMKKVQATRHYDTMVRDAFSDPQPATQGAPSAVTKTRRVPLVGNASVRAPAMAAALAALAIGVLIGVAVSSQGGSDRGPAYAREEARSLQRALEREPSGVPVSWASPANDSRGDVTPVSTYRNSNGEFCREFEQRRVIGNQSITEGGIACRATNGRWRVRIRYFPK